MIEYLPWLALLLVLLCYATEIVGTFIKETIEEMKKARVENAITEAGPFISSDRHRGMAHLVIGMADELAVSDITYERKDGVLTVTIQLSWWAVPGFLYRPRLQRKMEKLLGEINEQ